MLFLRGGVSLLGINHMLFYKNTWRCSPHSGLCCSPVLGRQNYWWTWIYEQWGEGDGILNVKSDILVTSYTQQNKNSLFMKSSRETKCVCQAAWAVNTVPDRWFTNQCESLDIVIPIREVSWGKGFMISGTSLLSLHPTPWQNWLRYPPKSTRKGCGQRYAGSWAWKGPYLVTK